MSDFYNTLMQVLIFSQLYTNNVINLYDYHLHQSDANWLWINKT